MEKHNIAVEKIAAQVRHFCDSGVTFRIYHGSTNSTRYSARHKSNVIDTSRLSHVLEVDNHTKTALVEPNVPMDHLVETTLQHGLVPPVIMEFPGITAGGGFVGTGAESSSCKHGYFSANRIEMVLGNGDVVHASRNENEDLFYGAAGSLGTLGVLTLLEIPLLEAKQFVEVTYYPVWSVSEAISKIQDAANDRHIDYVDGILYAKNRGVIITGRLTDTCKPNIKVQRFSRAQDPWFYLYAEKATKNSGKTIAEAVPLLDYLFRYDRGAFWMGRYAFKYFITPFDWLSRYILNRLMHTRVLYRALHESGLIKSYIIQDLVFPPSTAPEFITYIDQVLQIYPLWLCPIRTSSQKTMHPRSTLPGSGETSTENLLINVGVWGSGPRKREEFIHVNRQLEQKVKALHGMKWLYAETYYTEDEFWKIYDGEQYHELRKKYRAGSLPTMYDKVKADVEAQKRALEGTSLPWFLRVLWQIWPVSGVYGLWRTIARRDYLLKEKVA